MEQCASVLLSFPPDQKLSDEQYHKAARQHVQALDRLIQERVILPYAERLLEVCITTACICVSSSLRRELELSPASLPKGVRVVLCHPSIYTNCLFVDLGCQSQRQHDIIPCPLGNSLFRIEVDSGFRSSPWPDHHLPHGL